MSHSLSDTVLQSMKEGVLSLDGAGRITLFNEAGAALFGLSVDSVLHRTFAEVFLDCDGADAFTQAILDSIQHDQQWTCREVDIRSADGQARTLQVTTSYLRDGATPGAGRRVVAVFRDVTELRVLADKKAALTRQMEETHRELQQAYLEVEGKNRELGEAARRVQFLRIAITAVVLVLVAGLGWYSAGLPGAAEDGPTEADGGIIPERTYRVTHGVLRQRVRLSGFLEPARRVNVVVPISGRLLRLNLRPGDTVQAAQLVAEVEDDGLGNRIRSAQLNAMRARTRFNELKEWSSSGEVQEAKRNLMLAELSLGEQQRALTEGERLYSKDIISLQELQGLRSAKERGEIAVETARQGLSQVESRASAEALQQAQIELQMAEEDLGQVQAEARQREIRAPISGVVLTPPAAAGGPPAPPAEGDPVAAGALLASIGDTGSFAVVLKIDELHVHQIRLGQNATIGFDAFPDLRLEGRVDAISEQAEWEGSTPHFKVHVRLDEQLQPEGPKLLLGMSADVEIAASRTGDVLTVPLEALHGADGEYFVWIEPQQPGASGLEKRPVTIGLRDYESAEVLSGLQKDDIIRY